MSGMALVPRQALILALCATDSARVPSSCSDVPDADAPPRKEHYAR